jgi:3-hydroxyisobutyrate dehydrogenase-like beta-hydroxyacid dehydrogenase
MLSPFQHIHARARLEDSQSQKRAPRYSFEPEEDEMPETIGFVGLGAMGGSMAGRLLEAGYRLRVWNRTISKAEPLLRAGAVTAGSPAEAAVRGSIVISMLADDAALEDVTFGEAGLLAGLGERGLHISMSTIAPATARRLAEAHAARGAAYLAAPVFGRPEVAAAGRLWVLASGAAAARERARPLLEAIGQQTFEFGDDPGAANVVKLAGNFLLIAAIEAMAEAYTFGEKNGIDRAAMASLFGSTCSPARSTRTTAGWSRSSGRQRAASAWHWRSRT